MARDKFVSIIVGIISTAGLFLFYALTMRFLAGSWDAAWWQFRQLWYLMTPLAIGFGVQIGLFSYIKSLAKQGISKGIMAASSTASGLGMIACCAHHVTDIASLLGVSVLSAWLTAYQRPLLIIAILTNFVGIIYLIRAKTSLFFDKPKVV